METYVDLSRETNRNNIKYKLALLLYHLYKNFKLNHLLFIIVIYLMKRIFSNITLQIELE